MSNGLVKRIYLSGSMTGTKFEDQMEWRCWFEQALKDTGVYCFNPPAHFSPDYADNNLSDSSGYRSDREVMQYDLLQLSKADLVIVNFDIGNKSSLGTMAEIAIAYDHRIPIIGICKNMYTLHPWQRDMCERIFSTKEWALQYLVTHYVGE